MDSKVVSRELSAAAVEGKKRERGGNYSSAERELLLELVVKYEAIECKKTDAVSSREKADAWKKVAAEFNALAVTARTWEQLKQVCTVF